MAKRLRTILPAFCFLCIQVSAASAVVLEARFDGTARFNENESALFGSDLNSNERFTAVIRFDTTRGMLDSVPGLYESLFGGFESYDISSPVISARLSINNITAQLTGRKEGIAYIERALAVFVASDDIATSETSYRRTYLDFSPYFPSFLEPQDITLFKYVPKGAYFGGGRFEYFNYDFQSQQFLDYTSANLIIQNYELAAVPEPSTWSSMIVGFSLIGTIYRRRRCSGSRLALAFVGHRNPLAASRARVSAEKSVLA
jgi:PEP-CTERM motif